MKRVFILPIPSDYSMDQNQGKHTMCRASAKRASWALVVFLLPWPASAGETPECVTSSDLPAVEVVHQVAQAAGTLPRFELGVIHSETHQVLSFAEGTFEGSITGWDTERLPDEGSALIQTQVVRSGDRALQISIGPDDRKIMGSWRSEVKDPYRVGMNQPAWHRFSVLIPEDYAIEKADAFVFAQWHQLKQPGDDRRRSPPLSFRIRDGRLDLIGKVPTAERPIKGQQTLLYSQEEFPTGVWHDFKVYAVWSTEPDGQIKIWLDGTLVTDYRGKTGFDAKMGPIVKIGLYSWQPIEAKYSLYFDDYARGDSEASLLPAPPALGPRLGQTHQSQLPRLAAITRSAVPRPLKGMTVEDFVLLYREALKRLHPDDPSGWKLSDDVVLQRLLEARIDVDQDKGWIYPDWHLRRFLKGVPWAGPEWTRSYRDLTIDEMVEDAMAKGLPPEMEGDLRAVWQAGTGAPGMPGSTIGERLEAGGSRPNDEFTATLRRLADGPPQPLDTLGASLQSWARANLQLLAPGGG